MMNERPNLNPPDPPETMDEVYEKYRFTDYTCDGYGGETEKFAITDYADCLYRAQCLAQYSHDDVRIQGLRKGKWETIETVKADYFEGEIFQLKKKLAEAVTEIATLRARLREAKE